MSHVFMLTVTKHRVPRWFTEGMAVHEETAASPEWGDRLGPDEIARDQGQKLLPIAELDRGFIHPVRPQQVVDQLLPGRQDLRLHQREMGLGHAARDAATISRNSEDTPTVIRKELKMEPAEFDKQFLAHARSRDQERRRRASTSGRSG